MNDTIYLALTAAGFAISKADNPSALLQIAMTSNYVFDKNAQVAIRVTDSKQSITSDDPLNNLVFKITFKDKVDGGVITEMTGKLFTGGGIDALEATYGKNFSAIAQKLDFYGAMDNENDFFDVVETRYNKAQAAAITTALTAAGALNSLNSYRVKEVVLDVPETTGDLTADVTPAALEAMILKSAQRPNYIALCNLDDLQIIEALCHVIDKLNIHLFIDVGYMTDWRNVVALVNSLDYNDQRIRILWNPNKSRPSSASTVLSRQKWRPCVGDYLAQHLLRNAMTNEKGIPPLHVPVGGYYFPLNFKGMKQLDGVELDDEAQNALAEAHVIVVLNERYQNSTRWVYGDVLTQRDSKNSVLRLANAAEIETFTANNVIDIAKKHLLKPMSNYIEKANDECGDFLDDCVSAGLLVKSDDLGGLYYAVSITPKADKPFEAVDIELHRRPEGAARQAYLKTTVNK